MSKKLIFLIDFDITISKRDSTDTRLFRNIKMKVIRFISLETDLQIIERLKWRTFRLLELELERLSFVKKIRLIFLSLRILMRFWTI